MSRKRHPYRSLANGLILGYVLIAATYVFLSAMRLVAAHPHVEFRDGVIPALNVVVIVTFFAIVGGSVGSFLNVVVWRMPQGLSVNGSSFCPRCRNKLRARDNVPVMGWLWLRGRCRDCRLPISPRYPIVEALLAITFSLVGSLEIFSWNLPYRSQPFRSGVAAMPTVDWGIIATVFYHLVGLAVIWAMGLICYDRNSIPGKLFLFGSLWLIGGMLLSPSFAIVPWQLSVPVGWPPHDWWYELPYWRTRRLVGEHGWDAAMLVQAAVRVATALVAAGFYARVLSKAFCPEANLKSEPLAKQTVRLVDLTVLLSAVVIIVGWQAGLGLIVITSVLSKILRRSPIERRTDPFGRFAISLPITTSLVLAFWRPLWETRYWPSEHASRGVLLVYGLLLLVAALWLSERVAKNPDNETPQELGDDTEPISEPVPANQLN